MKRQHPESAMQRSFTADDQRIEMVPECGCWIWLRATCPRGYGRVGIGKHRTYLAHRMFFEKARGAIPKPLVLDHLCRVKSCVNPDHLRAVTRRQNNTENSNSMAARNARKTACPRCAGPYTAVGRGRRCRECDRSGARKHHASNREYRNEYKRAVRWTAGL